MKPKELYPELADYIFDYCSKYFRPNEIAAHKHLEAIERSKYYVSPSMFKLLHHMDSVSTDQDVLNLVKDGFIAYKQKVVERIFRECHSELELNLCPKCGKIARTPLAKQCRFCGYSWRDIVE